MSVQKSNENTLSKDIDGIEILIVEDSPINADVLRLFLEDMGIVNISIAKTGEEAMALFSKKLDVIFMDIKLPGTDGFELTHHYRKVFPKMDTPIICWSTLGESQRKKCIDAGMDDFLPKPATLEDIKEALECWVPHRIDRKK